MESSNDLTLAESLSMLKALYDFQAVYAKTISFEEGEHFILYQTSAKQRNWWQVINRNGSIGFVPSNYVTKVKVEPEFMLDFLDASIECLKFSKETEINGIMSKVELLERLQQKKDHIKGLLASLENSSDNVAKETISNGSIKITKELKQSTKEANIELQQPKIETPQYPQVMPCSPSMTSILSKPEEIQTPTTHDNSITSDRSEATNTTSDDATTVISKTETNDEGSEEIHSQATCNSIPRITKSHYKDSKSTKNGSIHHHHHHQHHHHKDEDDDDDDDDDDRNHFDKEIVHQSQVYQIVDSIRQNTNLSHELSCVALRVVLSELETIFSTKIIHFLDPIATHLSSSLEAPDDFIEHTHDGQRLRVIFSQLAECKNDSEQRTWMLYEDEEDITLFLKELIEILRNADKKICKYELIQDQYQSIINLVQYYQMETRWPIRQLLLDAFQALCQLEANAVDILLTSVLPMELVQDLRTTTIHLDRLKEVVVMLTMIFSSGQKLPIHNQEYFDAELLQHLINIIENPPKNDVHDLVSDLMLNLILAINLQYDDFTQNYVLAAMRDVSSAKTFTEKILILLNREENPISFFDHSPVFVNPVLKMFVDLFSSPETASLFYSNDNKVLIDILVRQLSDLSPGDVLRRWYLELCRRIVRNTDYTNHCHRKTDLMKIFTRIFCEESECSFKDQQLVREIANEFPHIFKA